VTAWLEVIDDVLRQPAISHRPDLAGRLGRLRRRLLDPSIRVVVVGQIKQGKSQLVNALINASICPVHDDVATAVPTVIQHSAQPWARLVHPGGRAQVPIDRVARAITSGEYVRAEVGVPRTLLDGGLVLVDTPGVDGLRSEHASRTLAELSEADAVLVVSDAVSEFTAGEVQFLQFASAICPNVVGVVTKTDLSTQWRQCLDRDRALLAQAGLAIPLLAVSSVLRERAVRTSDQRLNEESGFPALVAHLENGVKSQASLLARRSAREAVLTATEQVAVGLRAQMSTAEPDTNTMAALEAAQRAAEDLRRRSSRWQNTLMDGLANLASDVDHDLRERTRIILRHTDSTFDKMDPATTWQPYGDWLSGALTDAVVHNFTWTVERTQWLARQIARHFAEESARVLPDLGLSDPMDLVDRMGALSEPDLSQPKIGHKMITGLRGSYSGMLMFGLLTSLLGMPLINVVSVGAGAVMGAKTLKEERESQLKRRQAVAKTAVQRHVDELVFQVGKHSRDALRDVQRILRDHFTELAEQLQDSINDSIRTARESANADLVARNRRNQEIAGEIEELVALRRRAHALVPAGIAA
jgi:GTPase Era involved in 16S rRNA processing